jgi:hypothetical protein
MRNEKAMKYDFWPTPSWIADEIVSMLADKTTVIDNSVGHGAITEALLR